jgi:hypothetical protein
MNRLTKCSLLTSLRPGPGRYSLPNLAALLFIWNITYTPLHLASDHHLERAEFAVIGGTALAGNFSGDHDVSTEPATVPAPASKQTSSHSAQDHFAAIFAFSSAIVPALESEFETSWSLPTDANDVYELQLRLSGARAPPTITL